MTLSKRYDAQNQEPRIVQQWQEEDVYSFDDQSTAPVYSIDTPPPTVSGNLHLGHAYSYSQTDFIARYWRMKGYNVFYPIGFDDNGLPTERLMEKLEGIRAESLGRGAYIDRCLAVSEEFEATYEAFFRRLGLSVDWRYKYRTVSEEAQRLAQWSFIDLYHGGRVHRQLAPVIWCPHCHTAIAQAEVDDLERETTFYTLHFRMDDGREIPIATTRPELLPACVAIFLHPDDARVADLLNHTARVPLVDRRVPILTDHAVEREKGTGIVMCCTFGDSADVTWWRTYDLPLINSIGADGALLESAGSYAGMEVKEARRQIVSDLRDAGAIHNETVAEQTVRTHERCDTPIDYVVSPQWFVELLRERQSFLDAGRALAWHPPAMQARYEQWVENLGWDWCISRQRTFGVPFPVWYCAACGTIKLADVDDLPVDPSSKDPSVSCEACGSTHFAPDTDVMDTWATSSLSPQIAGRMESDRALYDKVFPYSLRPQAHEIIRTWAFYTIVKSHYHFAQQPWHNVAISGWGLAPAGAGKISKSRGGGPIDVSTAIERYSADAIRYWAASTAFGKDSVIDERKMQAGVKLINKLWNVARFSQRFLEDRAPADDGATLTPADRWIASRAQRLVRRVTQLFEAFDYATAKSEIESFFWTEVADNYLEMAKKRLYDGGSDARGARETLRQLLGLTLQLLAPFLPFVTETIYRELFTADESIHRSAWPTPQKEAIDERSERVGQTLVEVATAVRRYKSESSLSLAAELSRLHLAVADTDLQQPLREARVDLSSITRARHVTVSDSEDSALAPIGRAGIVSVAIAL